jgi:NAD(P)-dependent dehydrogenase (short-subunit alcohol dehydrogenase family)
MAGPLQDKVAIVTGASRGIGLGIAGRFAADGARVVLCARSEALLAENARRIPGSASIALDLRETDAARQLVVFTLTRFGCIDIVVNNAGATKRGDFLALTGEDFADGFALKFFGAVRVTREAWPHLKATRGSLIFISGVGGRTPGAQFTIGGPVNAAVLSFTKAMAELGIADGVQVNCINPGAIRTDRYTARIEALAKLRGTDPASAEAEFVQEHRVTRIGEPSDIAALAAFVASPDGRFLQGSIIDMDGGATKTV